MNGGVLTIRGGWGKKAGCLDKQTSSVMNYRKQFFFSTLWGILFQHLLESSELSFALNTCTFFRVGLKSNKYCISLTLIWLKFCHLCRSRLKGGQYEEGFSFLFFQSLRIVTNTEVFALKQSERFENREQRLRGGNLRDQKSLPKSKAKPNSKIPDYCLCPKRDDANPVASLSQN